MAAVTKVSSLKFSVSPKSMKLKKHHHTSVTLRAVPEPISTFNHAEIIASIKHGKGHFIYTKDMKSLLSSLGLTHKDMRPLEHYLESKVRDGMKHPDKILNIVATILANGCTPHFTLDVSNTEESSSSETLSIS